MTWWGQAPAPLLLPLPSLFCRNSVSAIFCATVAEAALYMCYRLGLPPPLRLLPPPSRPGLGPLRAALALQGSLPPRLLPVFSTRSPHP